MTTDIKITIKTGLSPDLLEAFDTIETSNRIDFTGTDLVLYPDDITGIEKDLQTIENMTQKLIATYKQTGDPAETIRLIRAA